MADRPPLPAASATAIFIHGSHRDQAYRLCFVNRLVSFADLDGYPHRADFIAAYATSGDEQARRIQAHLLAESGLLSARDVAYCADCAKAREALDQPEIA
jgi:hypothetical protein